MKKQHLFFNLIGASTLALASCSSDDGGKQTVPPDENQGKTSKYLITATPVASEGVADYILTADDLSKGSISTVGNGVEQDGTYRYYVTKNNKFFSLLYGQGNPGAVTTYELNAEGNLVKLSDFQSETVQAFAPIQDDILLTKISRNAENPYAYWYRLDTKTSEFVAEGQINTQKLADKENGELAFFTWITQVGDKVFMPYFTVKGCCNDTFGTEYPDEANIAVYSYPEMKLEKVIHDSRTSYIGRYFVNGLSVDEKGDAYAFSSAVASTNGELSTTKPSSITRIKKGETEFDQTYLFNIEAAANGKYVTTHLYLGNGKFLVNLGLAEEKGAYSTGKEYAIVDAYSKTLTAVTGIPSLENIVGVTLRNNLVSEDGKTAYLGITTKTGSYVYNVDIATAIATQGLEVQGGVITAISKLTSK